MSSVLPVSSPGPSERDVRFRSQRRASCARNSFGIPRVNISIIASTCSAMFGPCTPLALVIATPRASKRRRDDLVQPRRHRAEPAQRGARAPARRRTDPAGDDHVRVGERAREVVACGGERDGDAPVEARERGRGSSATSAESGGRSIRTRRTWSAGRPRVRAAERRRVAGREGFFVGFVDRVLGRHSGILVRRRAGVSTLALRAINSSPAARSGTKGCVGPGSAGRRARSRAGRRAPWRSRARRAARDRRRTECRAWRAPSSRRPRPTRRRAGARVSLPAARPRAPRCAEPASGARVLARGACGGGGAGGARARNRTSAGARRLSHGSVALAAR